jgi:hypothetical protein
VTVYRCLFRFKSEEWKEIKKEHNLILHIKLLSFLSLSIHLI